MKKQLVLASLIMLGIFTISCGGKNGETKSESEAKTEEVADCPCNSLMDESGSLKNKNFTGICADKDQNDTIILKREYKNGYLISEMTKQKVNGKYYITKEMTYDNGKELNGFNISTNTYGGCLCISKYDEYDNGKVIKSYKTDIYGKSISAAWHIKDGVVLDEYSDENINEESRPKSMPDAEPDFGYRLGSANIWRLEDLDPSTFDKVIKDLEKEFPHFFYSDNN